MKRLDPLGAKCRDIRPLLKEIDPAFEITFDYEAERYEITHNGSLFEYVPYGRVDRALIARIAHTVWLNKTNKVFDYVDKQNEKAAKSEDRRLSNYTESLAKDLRRPLINSYDYGE